MAPIAERLSSLIPEFTPYVGGEELRRASAALGGMRQLGAGPGVDSSPSGIPALPAALRERFQDILNVEDGDFRIRELCLAAKRYSDAVEGTSGRTSYDALYNHGLVLQELASNLGKQPHLQIQFLRDACKRYEMAAAARPEEASSWYNWGVALSDLARLLSESDEIESEVCLREASDKYASCVEANAAHQQALNNWGLVLQDLSARAPDEVSRDRLVDFAIEKFRACLRLRPDFDRSTYNLGIVCYNQGQLLQASAADIGAADDGASEQPKSSSTRAASGSSRGGDDGRAVSAEYQVVASERGAGTEGGGDFDKGYLPKAAQYICLAYALKPNSSTYIRSASIVSPLLPLPFLRRGRLIAVRQGTEGTLHEAWEPFTFVLTTAAFGAVERLPDPSDPTPKVDACHEGSQTRPAAAQPQTASGSGPGRPQGASGDATQLPSMRLRHIGAVKQCVDPSLPAGFPFWVSRKDTGEGHYFVAESAEDAAVWVDVLLLAALVVQQGTMAALEALLDRRREQLRGKAVVQR